MTLSAANLFSAATAQQVNNFILHNPQFVRHAVTVDTTVGGASEYILNSYNTASRVIDASNRAASIGSPFRHSAPRAIAKHTAAGIWGSVCGTALAGLFDSLMNLTGFVANNTSRDVLKAISTSIFGGGGGMITGGAAFKRGSLVLAAGASGLLTGITSAILFTIGVGIATVAPVAAGIGIAVGATGGTLKARSKAKEFERKRKLLIPAGKRLTELIADRDFVTDFLEQYPEELDRFGEEL